MTAKRWARSVAFVFLAISILLIGAWCSVAVWYQCETGEPLCGFSTGLSAAVTLIVVASLATRQRWMAVAIYSACFALFLAWWATISPMPDRNWAPDVARNVTAKIDGDRAVVSNVRNFVWRGEADFDERWERRTYDLSQVV